MTRHTRRLLALFVVVTLALSTVPGPAAAETRAGGTVIVEAGETTGDLEVVGGDVVIRGTVDGDLAAFGGNVRIVGTVTGNVEAVGGNIHVGGTIEGDLSGAAGHLRITEEGTVGGSVEVGAGSVLIAGSVGGDAQIGAESLTLDPSARLGGNLEYAGTLNRADSAQVAGTVTKNTDINVGPLPQLAGFAVSVYFLLVNLVVGAILLLAFPRFADELVDRTFDRPGVTGLVGFGTLVAVPIALVLIALTIVGIPITLVGFLVYVVGLWLGSVYGQYVLGSWLLSMARYEHRWFALVVGMLVVFAFGQLPVIGDVVELAVLVWGLGALALGLYTTYRRGRFGGEAASTATGGEAAPAD